MDLSLPTVLYTPTAGAAAGQVATGRVIVYSIRALSSSASRRFVQLFDSVGVPPDGTIPRMVFQLEANGERDWHCQGTPRSFAQGLVWGFSSTGNTHTLAAPECWLEVQYAIA